MICSLLQALTIVNALAFVPQAQARNADTAVVQINAPRHSGMGRAVETLSIGVVDGPAEYAFTSVDDVAIGTDGSILVLDGAGLGAGPPSLRLYDARGRFVRYVGRTGRGPGEYLRPDAVAIMPDGSLLLLDALNRRLIMYSKAGEHSDTWTIPFYQIAATRSRMTVGADGVIAIRVRLSAQPRQDGIVRIRKGGAVIDTLPQPELPDLRQIVTVTRQVGSTTVRSTLSLPYAPSSRWEWSPLGYFVTGVSSRYAIDLRQPRRGTGTSVPLTSQASPQVVSLRMPAAQIPISQAERADQRAYIDDQLRRIRGQRSGSMPAIPNVKPFYSDFAIGADGRIWVRVHATSERYTPAPSQTRGGSSRPQIGWREPHVVDVLEPDGRYVGRAQLPYELRPRAIRGDEIWGVVHEEFGVPVLKRYRLQWK